MRDIVQSIESVEPAQLADYLSKKEWKKTANLRDVVSIWHQDNDDEAEVVLPLEKSLKDYKYRLRDALEAIASYEKRDISDVVKEILRFFQNVVSVRVIHTDTNKGTIPLADGILLIAKAQELLMSAGHSIKAKKKVFNGPASKNVREYLDGVLLGQTEVSSYVVNVIAPVQPKPVELVEVGSLSEQIMQNLIASLAALHDASTSYAKKHDFEPFRKAVSKGASANMCEALLGFSGLAQSRDFEVTIEMANQSKSSSESHVFRFDADQTQALKVAANYYKDDYILYDLVLLGNVTSLSRSQSDEAGVIVVTAKIEGKERKVQVDLDQERYAIAIEAHRNKILVQCSGDVHVKARSIRLINLGSFSLIGENNVI